MTFQLDLEFTQAAPEVSIEQVERLCSYLEGKGWVKATVIEAELKAADPDLSMNERVIRKIAECSDGRIFSYPGSPGYKLFTPALEIAEFERGDSLWAAQITRMIERRTAYRRRFHRCCRP